MEKPSTPPATMWLEADKREISLQGIVNALYASLEAENKSLFSWLIGQRTQACKKYLPNDFRFRIMFGLSRTLPQEKTEQDFIKQTLKNDLEKRLQSYSMRTRQLIGETLTRANREIEVMQMRVDSMLTISLRDFDMYACNTITVKRRIRKMLDDDIVSERLKVNSIDGKETVLLDSLVSWAIFRKITIEQDALPGCSSFVHASYQRVHQQMMEVAQNLTSVPSGDEKHVGLLGDLKTDNTAESPAPPSSEEPELPWWQTKYDIFEMATNKGASLKANRESTSNTAIAKEIEKHINNIERSKATGKTSPHWDTIRGVLTGWKWKPD